LKRVSVTFLNNYKKTVKEININDKDSYGTGISTYDCQNSTFCNDDHGHILTGDLRFVKNTTLRKLLSKGPNFREAKTINWNKSKDNIIVGLEKCIAKMKKCDNSITEESLATWKSKVIQNVDAKIRQLKLKIKPHKTNPVLRQPAVIDHLSSLHKKYVFVPIDKAANNVAIICKKFYVETILKEIGILGQGNVTYEMASKTKEEIINDNIGYSEHLNLKVADKHKDLPMMYWMPKMHKSPVGTRFIIASKHCSSKPISKSVSNAFNLISKQVENFHKKSKFLSNYNKFWVLKNADPIIKAINKINGKKRAKNIDTYDFSTLYTKIPHHILIQRLSAIINFVYKGGDKNCIRLSSNGTAFWGKKAKGCVGFTKTSLLITIKYLIQNCYFVVGDTTLRQAIGIPMGIDPAPFWANLFLYTYEEEYMSSLILTNKMKARHFHSTKRFIDDLCAINDGGEFGRVFANIYPNELDLKTEHSGSQASFLNLDITIKEGKFIYKLYDKRDTFPFFIVRMPHIDSNIPYSIFYSALVGEILRIARSTLLLEDFLPGAKCLLSRMRTQGADGHLSRKYIRKLIISHPECFSHFRLSSDDLLNQMT